MLRNIPKNMTVDVFCTTVFMVKRLYITQFIMNFYFFKLSQSKVPSSGQKDMDELYFCLACIFKITFLITPTSPHLPLNLDQDYSKILRCTST